MGKLKGIKKALFKVLVLKKGFEVIKSNERSDLSTIADNRQTVKECFNKGVVTKQNS